LKRPGMLFEVSWDIPDKLGGLHTSLSTKARSAVERMGEHYVVVGPWQLSHAESTPAFEAEDGFEAFAEGCRGVGVPVRVGRWNIPGRPRALLVEFSGLIAQRDDVLRRLWDDHHVDSLAAGWDYVEPCLFGVAAGIVIERWWRDHMQGATGPAVAQFHEWPAGAGLLHLKRTCPRSAPSSPRTRRRSPARSRRPE
jgi:glycogen phosphorylase/synthase